MTMMKFVYTILKCVLFTRASERARSLIWFVLGLVWHRMNRRLHIDLEGLPELEEPR